MTVEQQVADLTTSVDTLTGEVLTLKAVGDAAAADAVAARDASQGYRDAAEDHKDNALIAQNAAETASANALSAVTYQNLSGAETTLAVDAVAVWKGVLPNIPLREQITKSWFSELGPMPTTGLVLAGPNGATVYSLDTGSPVVWAPIQRGTGNPLWSSGDIIPTSIGWDGATLLIGQNGPTAVGGLSVFDFLKDEAYLTTSNDTTYYNLTSIAGRNSGTSLTTHSGSKRFMGLVDRNINAIATYTAPNAPLNEAGLPISTLAVFTDGGVSVILEDDTINNSLFAEATGIGDFTDDGGLWFAKSDASAHKLNFASAADYRAGDGFGDTVADERSGLEEFDLLTRSEALAISGESLILLGFSGSASDAVDGVMRHYPNYQDQSKDLSQLQTPDYATPLMFGDCKFAGLCEADDTDLVKTPLNSTTNYAAQWLQTEDGWTINATSLVCDGVDALEYAFLPGGQTGLEVGDQVAFEIEITSYTSGELFINLDNGQGGDELGPITAVGEYRLVGKSTTTPTVYLRSENFAGTVENLIISRPAPDRSVNGKGLILGPDPLAAAYINGGKTVGYGPITPTNFPRQPYNADMDAGTGDYLYRGWAKFNPGQSTMTILARCTTSTTGLHVVKNSTSVSSTLRVRHAANFYSGNISLDDSQWRCLTVLRRNGVLEAYIEDVLDILTAETSDISDTEPMLEVGYCTANPMVHNLTGKSIFSFSLGAPTPEQVRVAYLAERPRFYGGAVDPTLPEAGLGAHLDPVTGLYHMVGATKQWAVDPDGLIVPSSVANKADAAHNRITVFDDEVSTWEYAG